MKWLSIREFSITDTPSNFDMHPRSEVVNAASLGKKIVALRNSNFVVPTRVLVPPDCEFAHPMNALVPLICEVALPMKEVVHPNYGFDPCINEIVLRMKEVVHPDCDFVLPMNDGLEINMLCSNKLNQNRLFLTRPKAKPPAAAAMFGTIITKPPQHVTAPQLHGLLTSTE